MEAYDWVGHHNLHVDLVEHVFNALVNPIVHDFYDDTDDNSDMFVDDSDKDYDDVMTDDD